MVVTPNPTPIGPRLGNLLYTIIVVLVILAVLSYFIPIAGLPAFGLPGGFVGLILLLVLLRFLGLF